MKMSLHAVLILSIHNTQDPVLQILIFTLLVNLLLLQRYMKSSTTSFDMKIYYDPYHSHLKYLKPLEF